ncbi:ATP-binding protein [Variovorax humicola]|uniref:histidine kinase n=1 Tax=Variovorax humicola TaxID=1769758 RepID=A0ABU8W4X2_9BURK
MPAPIPALSQRPSHRRRLNVIALWLFLICGGAMAEPGRNVLVLYSNGRLVPGNVEVEGALRDAIHSTIARPVHINSEFLDRPEFVSDAYEQVMTSYLRDKYVEHRPHVVVAIGRDALDFMLRQRGQLFPRAPLVHAAMLGTLPRAIGNLPMDVVGVPIEYDVPATIEQALRWHPKARRLLVVTGSTRRDREWEAMLRERTAPLRDRVQIEFAAGMPTDQLARRLGRLDPDWLVLTGGFYQSGNDLWFTPRDSAEFIAQASAVPVYGLLSTFVGTGVVGGRAPRFQTAGDQAGQIVNRLLDGESPALLELPAVMANTLLVDWRQTRRWGIADEDIPIDAVVQFRPPSFWETYRTASLLGGAAILLETGLIALLLFEHHRRLKAETALAQRGTELAHASRLAIAGELTASIAHEINQPLAAILSNAEAAELLLESGRVDPGDLASILADIRRDDIRASDVISRLRTLLARQVGTRQPFELNAAIADGCELLAAEVRRRTMRLAIRPSANPVLVVGDAVQIQQVLINLVLNAMDAIGDRPEGRRAIRVSTVEQRDLVEIRVSDRGEGVAPENLARLFDSFFSTKRRGMGLGLSITRTIVDSHGGRIWAVSSPDEGTTFHVELPRVVEG